jgi:plastocyanin
MSIPSRRLALQLAAALLVAALLPARPALAEEEASAADEPATGAVRGTVQAAKGGEPTVVFLKDVPGDYVARVRLVEIKGNALAAKVVVAAVGDTLKFVNLDGQVHGVVSSEANLDLGLLDKGEARGQVFLRPGAYPLRCAVHKELLGWVFVAPSPHAAVADRSGAYEIRDVPAGKFAVGAWTPGAAKVADAGSSTVTAAEVSVSAAPAAPSAAPAAASRPKPAAAAAPKKPEPRTDSNGSIRGTVKAEPARYLEETVVYLKSVAGPFPPRKTAMDQRKMKFIPHVLTVSQGDTVRFLNNDGLAHNVYTNDGEGYNLGMWGDGEERPYTFKKTGTYAQLCNIHPEMLAYVFVGQNPYSTVVDSAGRFELRNVPPGTYTLSIWNSHLSAPEKQITVERGNATEASFVVKR